MTLTVESVIHSDVSAEINESVTLRGITQMTMTAAHLAEAINHACALPSEAMPAQADPSVLPADDYDLELCEADYGPNSKGTGSVLRCLAQVTKGPHAGRTYFLNYTLEHENQTAQEIGQRDFAALRRATGVLNPDTTDDLCWVPFRATIGIRKRKDTGEDENVIKQYHFGRDEQVNVRQPRSADNDNIDFAKAA